jgi:hypothetical protein
MYLISVQVECAQNIWNLLQGSKLAQLHEDEVGLEDDHYLLRQELSFAYSTSIPWSPLAS